jgi:hypothetical protein
MFNIDVTNSYYSRYDIAKFLDDSSGDYDILNSEFILRLSSLSKFGIFTVTTQEGRPELLAETIYGEGYHYLWWILMEFNNLIYPSDIKAGMLIQYPSISNLELIYFNLNPKFNNTWNVLV